MSAIEETVPDWTPTPVTTSWDDLLDGVTTVEDWETTRLSIRGRFLDLIRDAAAPEPPDLRLEVEREWSAGDFSIQYVSYQVEEDECAHAYVGIPSGTARRLARWPSGRCR